jgi:hypothetical protein
MMGSSKTAWTAITSKSMVKRRVMEQTMPAEDTGTGSRNTHAYKNQGNGRLSRRRENSVALNWNLAGLPISKVVG